MNFGKFIRKFRPDTDNDKLQDKSSLLSSTTKLFDSVNVEATNFVSKLSTKFENIKAKSSTEFKRDEERTSYPFDIISMENSTSFNADNGKQKSIYENVNDDYTEQFFEMERESIETNDIFCHEMSQMESQKYSVCLPIIPLAEQIPTPSVQYKSHTKDLFHDSQTIVDNDNFDNYFYHECLKVGNKLVDEALRKAKINCGELSRMEYGRNVAITDDLICFEEINCQLSFVTEQICPEYLNTNMDLSDFFPFNDERFSYDNVDSELDTIDNGDREFMEEFLDNVYNDGQNLNDQIVFGKFKNLIKTSCGKLFLIKLLERQFSTRSMKIPENAFFRLVHIFTITLLECQEEDYLTARDMMLLAIKCYTVVSYNGKRCHCNLYLSSFLKSHSIWKSISFWDVCFFKTAREDSLQLGIMDNFDYIDTGDLLYDCVSDNGGKKFNILNLTDDEMGRFKELMAVSKCFNVQEDICQSLL